MISTALVASMTILAPSITLAKTVPTAPPSWGTYQEQQVQPERRVVQHYWRTRRTRRSSHSTPDRTTPEKTAPSIEQQLREDIAALRRELDGIKAEVGVHKFEPSPLIRMISYGSPPVTLVEPAGLPDLRLGSQPEALPEPQPLPSLGRLEAEAVDRVRLARLYLIKTAVPGFTMTKLTPEVSIGRLHPAFAVRLAEAIKWAREHGLPHAGIYSAYRPPAFGIGGFGNKFFSMHSYGLAADIANIGGPGTHSAELWQKAVQTAGIFLPYGSNNRSEFNHTQLLSSKMAWGALRRTITASAPKNLREMWLASGVKADIPEIDPVQTAKSKLPIVDWTP